MAKRKEKKGDRKGRQKRKKTKKKKEKRKTKTRKGNHLTCEAFDVSQVPFVHTGPPERALQGPLGGGVVGIELCVRYDTS